jgi:hypothetical protein
MPTIQVSREHAPAIREAHRQWLQSVPRAPGQIGGQIGGLVEAVGAQAAGTIQTYSDSAPVIFINVEQAFVDFLTNEGILFDEVD